MSYRRHLTTAVAAATLGLAACNQNAAQTPATGAPIVSLPLAQAAPPPEALAPYVDQLPPARPLARVTRPRGQAYAYIDAAYELGDAFADSPPDYTFDYGGVRPYVWRSRDGEYRVVERTADGEREYFYRGDSAYPFLIRDTRYAYAYDNGGLVEVYDSYGRPYPDYASAQADAAARYLVRALALYGATTRSQRKAAYAADWRERRDAILAPQSQWTEERQRNEDWRRWRDQQAQPSGQQAAWTRERTQRQAYAAQTAAVVAAAVTAPRDRPPEARPDLARDRARADATNRQQAEIAAHAQGAPRQAHNEMHPGEPAAARLARQQQKQADGRVPADAQHDQLLARQRHDQAEDQRKAQQAAQERDKAQARAQAQVQRAAHDQQRAAERASAQAVRQQADAAARAGREQRAQQDRAAHEQQAQAAAQHARPAVAQAGKPRGDGDGKHPHPGKARPDKPEK